MRGAPRHGSALTWPAIGLERVKVRALSSLKEGVFGPKPLIRSCNGNCLAESDARQAVCGESVIHHTHDSVRACPSPEILGRFAETGR